MVVANYCLVKSMAPLKSENDKKIFELSKQIPHNWHGIAKCDSLFSITLNNDKPKKSAIYELPYKCCDSESLSIEVETCSSEISFMLLDNSNKTIVSSQFSVNDNGDDSLIVNIPPSYLQKNGSIHIQFITRPWATQDTIKVKNISLRQKELRL